ncbi:MAG: NRDE family protein [Proteobacteria bacterium]|nr:NRDE family protein [Pseudomonadota bacterium]
MCLILFSYKTHFCFDLILAGNRDEFYDRPTAPLAFFKDNPEILGGRDLKDNGTWLGISRAGRIAAITNFRDPASLKTNAPSRGMLVNDFLYGKDSPSGYLDRIHKTASRYNGFNLIAGDRDNLFYYSNREGKIKKILPGFHGLSNHLLDTPWPKVARGKAEIKTLVNHKDLDKERIFDLLQNDTRPPDRELPDTQVGLLWERLLSPIFIKSSHYGTRSSAILLMDKAGNISFTERTFSPENPEKGVFVKKTRTFSFQPVSRP